MIHVIRKSRWFFVALVGLGLIGCRIVEDQSNYRLLAEDDRWYGNLVWSPDGKRIAYRTSIDYGSGYEIMDLASQSREEVDIPIADLKGISYLFWIGEEEFAYFGLDMAGITGHLVIQNLSASTTEILWSMNGWVYDMCWLPTEQQFVFISAISTLPFKPAFGNVISAYDPTTDNVRIIYKTNDNDITDIGCSLSENKVAFTERSESGSDQINRLYVIAPYTQLDLQLLHETPRRITEPSWSPDGDWIAIREVSGTTKRIRRMLTFVSTDGSTIYELKEPPWYGQTLRDVDWSPVDNRLLLSQMDGSLFRSANSLYLYDFVAPDGGQQP